MPFNKKMYVNYDTHNFCAGCDLRFLKSKGIYCPDCGYQSRVTPKNRKKVRKPVQNAIISVKKIKVKNLFFEGIQTLQYSTRENYTSALNQFEKFCKKPMKIGDYKKLQMN